MPLDLLAWPEFDEQRKAFEHELEAAAQDVQEAHEDFTTAQRRARFAPHGEARCRQTALREANARVLRAELHYAQVRRREPSWD